MNTHTINYQDTDQLQAFLDEKKIVDNKQLLIQIFTGVTQKHEIEALQEDFLKLFSKASLIGTTTDGAINNGKLTQGIQTIISFSQFQDTKLATTILDHSEFHNDSYLTGQELAKKLISKETKAVISFSDGINTNGEEYLNGIFDVQPTVTVAGGMAGDNGFIIETFVFTKDAITNNGIVAVALNNKNLHIATDYSFNWTPIGKHMTITKAVKNQVFEIDGISAVDIYEKYMSKELAMRLPQIGIEFPLILERHGVEIGRAVLEKREDGSLIFAGNVNENDKVRFGIGNVEMIIRDSHYHARQLQEHPIESIFIYSCMARRRFVGTTLETELRPLQEMGPTSGFFTYGEFYHSPEAPQLLNETMTILALSESSDAFTNYIKEVTVEHHFGINPLHVISHLANTVTKELEELNGDLEQRVEENTEYILEQVYTDRLTKLPNRLKLIEQLPNFVGHYLILININDFTELNDFYGHYAGDTILEEFAQTLFHLAKREQMEVFKLPADEYALIAKNDDIQHYIEYLFNLLNNFIYHYQNNHIHINITMAAAQIYGDGHALANTDMSLKLAKRQSENFLIFEKDMMLSERYKLNLEMASSIRHALNHNQIVPYYQPIIDVKTGKVDKHECLARLIMPEGEVISPIHFLERSQKIRLYFEITKSIITTAFKKFQNSDEKFSINLSINDILNNDIKSFIFEKIQEYDVGKQLTFEILETQALENDDSITEFIYKAKRLGVSIAVDDFGSGFANFQHITKIDVDVIKIDGSLIRDISKDKNARVVVETIVSFAQKLGLKTVAEYVESPDIYHLTKELGIDYAQGYLLGKPEPDTIERTVENY